jgi:hypothetical protein
MHDPSLDHGVNLIDRESSDPCLGNRCGHAPEVYLARRGCRGEESIAACPHHRQTGGVLF